MNTQGWFLLGLTGLISLLSKGLSRVYSSTTIQKHQFFSSQPSERSNYHNHTRPLVKPEFCLKHLLFSKVMSLLCHTLSRFVIAFLPRSKHLLISRLQSLPRVTLEPKKINSVTASTFPPSICNEGIGPDTMIFAFQMLSFKSVLSFSSCTFIMRLFSSSSLFAISMALSAYLRLLIFLLADLIPACNSSSLAFHMMYTA